MIVGERLKIARKKKGYSQQELGDLLGVSKVSVCSYEKGIRTPNMKNFLDLIDILDIEPNYILGRDIDVVAEEDEKYKAVLSKEDLKIIKELKNNPMLYNKLCLDPRRTIELINRRLK